MFASLHLPFAQSTASNRHVDMPAMRLGKSCIACGSGAPRRKDDTFRFLCGSSRTGYFNFLVNVSSVNPMRLANFEGVHFAYIVPVCDAVVGNEVVDCHFVASVY